MTVPLLTVILAMYVTLSEALTSTSKILLLPGVGGVTVKLLTPPPLLIVVQEDSLLHLNLCGVEPLPGVKLRLTLVEVVLIVIERVSALLKTSVKAVPRDVPPEVKLTALSKIGAARVTE